jgi:ankyrin repeat protein
MNKKRIAALGIAVAGIAGVATKAYLNSRENSKTELSFPLLKTKTLGHETLSVLISEQLKREDFFVATYNALFFCKETERIRWLKEIIKKNGGDVNKLLIDKYDSSGTSQTYLSLAVEALRTDAVKFLLKNGADPNINVTFMGRVWSPLEMTFGEGYDDNTDIMKLLLEHGADIKGKYGYGDNNFMFGLIHAHIREPINFSELFNIARKYGVNINDVDDRGNTLLNINIDKEFYKSAEYLIDAGIDVNIQNKNGENSLMVLVNRNERPKWEFDNNITENENDPYNQYNQWHILYQDKILKKLIKSGVDINAKDNSGCTALINACKRHVPNMAEYLLDLEGIDVNAKEKGTSKTALDYAKENGLEKVAKKIEVKMIKDKMIKAKPNNKQLLLTR